MIDRVKAKPLHLKNNAWQQWHALTLKYAAARSDVGGCESVCDTPASGCFRKYYEALKCVLKASQFTGKESQIMCHNFMKLVNSLILHDDQPTHVFTLHIFAIIAVNLRDAVSIFCRINVPNEDARQLKEVSCKYFRALCIVFSCYTNNMDHWSYCTSSHSAN